MRKTLFSAVAAALLAAGAAHAHHSYAATYDVSKEVKIEGKLVQVSFRNPHSFVTVSAPDAKGAAQRWSIEWSGTSQLANQGVKSETLKVGDDVVIVGRPSRVPNEPKMLMVNLKRPKDGFSWGTGKGEADQERHHRERCPAHDAELAAEYLVVRADQPAQPVADFTGGDRAGHEDEQKQERGQRGHRRIN